MTLIHTALKAEAKPIVEFFKLKCIQRKPFMLYKKDDILLIVCGMGAKNTLHVEHVFKEWTIKKALNIGIAGCKDTQVEIGTIFTCNQKIENIKYADITSVKSPLGSASKLSTLLVDMEAESFTSTCRGYLDEKDIYVLKVVSDHLDTKIPKKEFVWKIIEQNLKSISRVVTFQN